MSILAPKRAAFEIIIRKDQSLIGCVKVNYTLELPSHALSIVSSKIFKKFESNCEEQYFEYTRAGKYCGAIKKPGPPVSNYNCSLKELLPSLPEFETTFIKPRIIFYDK